MHSEAATRPLRRQPAVPELSSCLGFAMKSQAHAFQSLTTQISKANAKCTAHKLVATLLTR